MNPLKGYAYGFFLYCLAFIAISMFSTINIIEAMCLGFTCGTVGQFLSFGRSQ